MGSVTVPTGYGIMVYDPSLENRTVVYDGKDIRMTAADLDELKSFVEDGMRFVRIEGTRWASK